MKVCIPSKDRAATMTTHLFFEPKDVLIFVEPQELRRYQIYWPDYTFIDIQKSNQGVQYVRNFILDNVKEDKIITIDDDTEYFGVRLETGRYSSLLFKQKEFLKDAEEQLEKHWSYLIPGEAFAYFTNVGTGNKRFIFNNSSVFGMFGLNLKRLRENNIRYDDTFFEAEDIDLAAQIILAGGDICEDYKYAFKHDVRSPGGISYFRKMKSYSYDSSARVAIYALSKKYGTEFVKMSFTPDGYVCSFRVDFKLLSKRKDLAKRNLEKYLKEKNTN